MGAFAPETPNTRYTMTTRTDTIEFLPAAEGQPGATALLFGLAGVCRALEVLSVTGDPDRELIGNLCTAADALASELAYRVGACPVTVQDSSE